MPESVEAAVEAILGTLRSRGWAFVDSPVDWHAYEVVADRIHSTFDIPATSITPQMRRLLFAIGNLWPEPSILGLGTYVGYAVSWLFAGAHARHNHAQLVGIDIDRDATGIARNNFERTFGEGVANFECRDALRPVEVDPVGVLYLDIDGPEDGKWGYLQAFETHKASLAPRGLVLAHDPLVKKFAAEITAFRELVSAAPGFGESIVLPVDNCGLLLANRSE